MSRASREKGKRGERELAATLRGLGFDGARRGQQYHGLEGEDVVGIPGLHIECKRTEALRLESAIGQAVADAEGSVPVVCSRKSRGDWLLTLRLVDLWRLVDALAAASRAPRGMDCREGE